MKCSFRAALSVAVALWGSCAWGQVLPSGTTSMVVPYPAGSASDLTARTLNDLVGKSLGNQVIVENIGGAGGAIAIGKVLAAPADGRYLFQGSPSELILAPLVNKGLHYEPDDFQFVAPVATSPLLIAVSGQLPVSSIDELVAYARSHKDRPLAYGSPGPGTLYHLLGEMFSKRVGVPMTHVPYKGGAPLLQDLMGGLIDFAFLPYQSSYPDIARQGRMKVVGSLSASALPPPFQSVQRTSDSALLKDFRYDIWTAYLVRKGTPRDVQQRANDAIANALKDPQARRQLEAQAKVLFEPMSLEAGAKFYAREITRYRDLAKASGVEAK